MRNFVGTVNLRGNQEKVCVKLTDRKLKERKREIERERGKKEIGRNKIIVRDATCDINIMQNMSSCVLCRCVCMNQAETDKFPQGLNSVSCKTLS